MLADRRRDGANQQGDEAGSDGKPYSDYTFYEPRNPIDRIVDPDRWQQIPFDDGKGGVYYPGFLTPPFPGFPSGHSMVSGTCSKMLELFTGYDRYGAYERHKAGKWTEAGFPVRDMQARDGRPAQGLPEDPEVILLLPTFTATAEMAGISRIMGGYHIQADNIEGLSLGRKVATFSWQKYQAYFSGTARE